MNIEERIDTLLSEVRKPNTGSILRRQQTKRKIKQMDKIDTSDDVTVANLTRKYREACKKYGYGSEEADAAKKRLEEYTGERQ